MADFTRRGSIQMGAVAALLATGAKTALADDVHDTGDGRSVSRKVLIGAEIRLKSESVKNIDAENASADYDVYVVNKSDWTITGIKNFETGEQAPITPPIGRTAPASMTCKDASAAGKYEPCIGGYCTNPVSQWQLLVSKGNQSGITDPFTIHPNCDYRGELVCFNTDGN